jgi:hypothetical protein
MSLESAAAPFAQIRTCDSCGAEIAPGLLSCPSCRRLTHADQLKMLAATAENAEQDGDLPAALAAWREALGLLPPQTRQYTAIADRIAELGRQIDALQVSQR